MENRNQGGVLLALVPRILFTLMGLSIVWFLFLRPFMEGSAANSWPTVKGTVESAESVSSSMRSSSGSGTHTTKMHKDTIVYRYVVEGQEFECDRIGVFTDWFVTRGGRRGSVRYTEGATPLVYYNPVHPEQAMLEPGMGPDRFVPYTLLALGGWFSILGAASIIHTLVRRQGQMRPSTSC